MWRQRRRGSDSDDWLHDLLHWWWLYYCQLNHFNISQSISSFLKDPSIPNMSAWVLGCPGLRLSSDLYLVCSKNQSLLFITLATQVSDNKQLHQWTTLWSTHSEESPGPHSYHRTLQAILHHQGLQLAPCSHLSVWDMNFNPISVHKKQTFLWNLSRSFIFSFMNPVMVEMTPCITSGRFNKLMPF